MKKPKYPFSLLENLDSYEPSKLETEQLTASSPPEDEHAKCIIDQNVWAFDRILSEFSADFT